MVSRWCKSLCIIDNFADINIFPLHSHACRIMTWQWNNKCQHFQNAMHSANCHGLDNVINTIVQVNQWRLPAQPPPEQFVQWQEQILLGFNKQQLCLVAWVTPLKERGTDLALKIDPSCLLNGELSQKIMRRLEMRNQQWNSWKCF